MRVKECSPLIVKLDNVQFKPCSERPQNSTFSFYFGSVSVQLTLVEWYGLVSRADAARTEAQADLARMAFEKGVEVKQ